MKKYWYGLVCALFVLSLFITASSPALENIPGDSTSRPVSSLLPTPTPAPSGSDGSSSNINPLTGLPVSDPANLSLQPALVSISTFPENARPEVGLSFASWIFEAYIGEGMTRYLAVYYGDLPEIIASDTADEVAIGPVRSGRLWYENARQLFSGFIVMASASANVKSNLNAYTNIFGSDAGNINSALIPISRLKSIAQKNSSHLHKGALEGNEYDSIAPEGGKTAQSLWVRWSYLNQVFWKFDPASGAYNRYQNGTTEARSQAFTVNTDRVNGDPLTIENVVLLFVNYQIKKNTNIDIELLEVTRPALLFRDGRMYEIKWTTVNDVYSRTTGIRRPIRFIDKDGNPFPLKPGQTWLEVVPMYTPYYETVDSEDILLMLRTKTPGSGHWAAVFYTPANTP